MTITTTRDKLRLVIGDTDSAAPLFYDDELDYFLDERSDNILLAAADACESAARKFARAYDFFTDDQRFFRSQQSQAYQTLADDLRARAVGITTIVPTRVDGNSDDIAADEIQTSTSNVFQRFYTVEGIDRLP